MKVTSYKELIVWQRSMELATEVFEITKAFPKTEQFGLTNQIRRATFSIPSNIAEGFCRGGRPEFRQFLQEDLYLSLMTKLTEIMRMLNKMITNIRKTNY